MVDLQFLIIQAVDNHERVASALAALAVATTLSTILAVASLLVCISAIRLAMLVQPRLPLAARFRTPAEYRLPLLAATATLVGFTATVLVVTGVLAPIPSPMRRGVYLSFATFALACAWGFASKYIYSVARRTGGLFRLAMPLLLLALSATWWTSGLLMIRFVLAAEVMLVVALAAYYRPAWRVWRIRLGVAVLSIIATVSLPWTFTDDAVELVYLSKSLPSYILRFLPPHNRAPTIRRIRAAIADRVAHPVARYDEAILQLPGMAPEPSTLPNILLITIDALRADRVGERPGVASITPNLDQLARSAWVFRHAYAAAPETIGSMSQLMTGLPWHEIPHLPAPLGAISQIAPGTPTLASKLTAVGYSTVAVLPGEILTIYPSLLLGFERVLTWDHKRARALDTDALFSRTIELQRSSGHQPLFTWMHCLETHGHASADGVDVDGYDRSVHHVDQEIGRLIAAIASGSQWRNTVLIITADHGEGLGEGGVIWHGTARAPILSIPLLVKMPGAAPAEVYTVVGTLDIHATILALAGLPGVTPVGKDLRLIASRPTEGGRTVFHSMAAYTTPLQVYEVGATRYPWQLVYQVRADFRMLRRLDRDPFGTLNVAGRGLPVEGELLEATLSSLLPDSGKTAATVSEPGEASRTHAYPSDGETTQKNR
jgi:hypothetical protein